MPLVSMPKLSDTMTEGILVKWLKNDGDRIEISEVIAEVETDKATMEMEAFDEGVLKIYAQEGAKVPIGNPIAFIAGDGEEAPASPAGAGAETAPLDEPDATEAPPPETPPVEPAPHAASAPTAPRAAGDKLKASPVAVKMAAARGIDLASLAGSGPGGRIIKRDILAATGGGPAPTPPSTPTPSAAKPPPLPGAAAKAPAPVQPTVSSGDERIALSGMRTIIAERLLASKTQIPHFYLHIELDAAPLMELRRQVNAAADADTDTNKYTINDFILKAAIGAAVAVPEANASFAGDAVIQFASVNLAVAVAIDDGLVTPVIRDAQTKSLLEISVAVKDLAERARSKRLSPDEFQGGTLTVSNLGAYGIESFDAIINPPQAAILSIGAIVGKPVVDANGEIVPGKRIDIGMSCDHRVVDGAVGARYLAEFRKIIENPALMLV